MSFWREFPGPNAAYILELYERYRIDPGLVDEETRRIFEQWRPPTDGAARGNARAPAGIALETVIGVANPRR